MAITVPEFTNPSVECYVNVNGSTLDTPITVRLNADQLSQWTDDGLQARVTDLRNAVASFLVEGAEVQTIVSWNQNGFATTINETDPVT